MLKSVLTITIYFLAALAVEIFLFLPDPTLRGIKYGVFIVTGMIVYNILGSRQAKKLFWIAFAVSLAAVCTVPVELVHKTENDAVTAQLEKDILRYKKNPTDTEWDLLCKKWSLDAEKDGIAKDDLEKLRAEVKRLKTVRDNTQIKLGTDLKGGFEILYEVLPVGGEGEAQIDERTLDIIRQRINNSGLTGNTVQSVGKNRILVQVPGYNVDEVKRVKEIIKKRGHLAFRLVCQNNTLVDQFLKIREDNEKIRRWNKEHPDKPRALRPYPEGYELMDLTEIVEREGRQKKRRETLLIEKKERLTGDDISRVYSTHDQYGRPAVGLDFTLLGRKKMARVTGKNIGRRLAIVLDGELKSAPTIQSRITRSAQITGDFSQEEVDAMIDVLKAGSLDIKMKELSEYSVEASLGKSSIESGIRSLVYAMVTVLAFMCIYYLKAGLIADATLFCNLLLIVGGLSLFQVTLTLPGIAGLLLTVGMSVDANIIIFERIREELKKRKARKESLEREELSAAVEKGYKSAFWTIFDANITTLITALILLIVGTGAIKGFAISLSIGIIGSMVSALVISRIFFQTLLDAGWFGNDIRMLGVLTNPAFTFVADKIRSPRGEGKGKGFFPLTWKFQTVSILFIIASTVLFFMRGESKYGVDFNGGSIIRVAFTGDVSAEDLRRNLSPRFPNVKVQQFYDPQRKAQKTFSIYLPSENEREKLKSLLKQALGSAPAELRAFTYSQDLQEKYRSMEWTVYTEKAGKTRVLTAARRIDAFFRGIDAAFTAAYEGTFPPARAVVEKLPLQELKTAAVHSAKNRLLMILILKKNRERLKSVLAELYAGKLAPEGVRSIEKTGGDAATAELVLERDLPDEEIIRRITAPGSASPFKNAEILSKENRTVRLRLLCADPAIGIHTIKKELTERLPVSRRFLGDNTIGATVASELRERGVIAIILALIAIIIYITVRFELNFSIGAVTALVHDVIITVGFVMAADMLGIVPIKIDLTILAAILTIIGYSLNDTIVVFDRIREHFPLKEERHQKSQTLPRHRIAALIDDGINSTLSRTILTSLTTLLVTVCLLVFGGGVIQGFAYALSVGVVVGTYSSIFIASPVVLLVHWLREKREKKKK